MFKIRITGKAKDHLFNELLKNKINIYHVKRNDKELEFIIKEKDYETLKSIKTSCKIEITNYYGKSKIKRYLSVYKKVIIFLLIGFIIDICLSNIVFTIEINHPKENIRKIVLQDLNENGIKKFHFVVSYQQKEQILKKILEKEKNSIEWLEINRQGTKYIVQVEERKKKEKEIECLPQNIVAKKNATILEINALSGQIMKKNQDYVTTGETIISGFIYNKEKIVSKICARGNVYGEVWYIGKVTLPKTYKEKNLTNRKKIGISTRIGIIEKNYGNTFPYFQKKEYNIIKSRIIPVKLSIAIYQKEKVLSREYQKREIEKLAYSKIEEQFKKRLKEDEQILSKKILKILSNNSKIEVEIFLKVKENITAYQDISKIEIYNEQGE